MLSEPNNHRISESSFVGDKLQTIIFALELDIEKLQTTETVIFLKYDASRLVTKVATYQNCHFVSSSSVNK